MKNKHFRPGWPSRFSSLFVIILVVGSIPATSAQIRISKKYERKAIKVLEEVFPQSSLSHEHIDGLGDDNHRFYRLRSKDKEVGTLVYSAAKGKHDYFDYLLILDKEQKVKRIQILRYRSDHGYQIASKRWLEGFTGYDGQDQLRLGKDIDAISGATISSNNLCKDLYFSINKLNQYIKAKPD